MGLTGICTHMLNSGVGAKSADTSLLAKNYYSTICHCSKRYLYEVSQGHRTRIIKLCQKDSEMELGVLVITLQSYYSNKVEFWTRATGAVDRSDLRDESTAEVIQSIMDDDWELVQIEAAGNNKTVVYFQRGRKEGQQNDYRNLDEIMDSHNGH